MPKGLKLCFFEAKIDHFQGLDIFSRLYIFAHRGSDASCLQDNGLNAQGLNHEADPRLPGQRYTAEAQCLLAHGEEFIPHLRTKHPYDVR